MVRETSGLDGRALKASPRAGAGASSAFPDRGGGRALPQMADEETAVSEVLAVSVWAPPTRARGQHLERQSLGFVCVKERETKCVFL